LPRDVSIFPDRCRDCLRDFPPAALLNKKIRRKNQRINYQ
jgi:hypothetical protein